jgi:hypothetical protein
MVAVAVAAIVIFAALVVQREIFEPLERYYRNRGKNAPRSARLGTRQLVMPNGPDAFGQSER